MPALNRIWNGVITPLDTDLIMREADLVFLALPDTAAAELAPKFADAGVTIYAFRFTFTADMTDAEYDYAFNATRALGATQITLGAFAIWQSRPPGLTTAHVVVGACTLAATFSLTWWAHRAAIERLSAPDTDRAASRAVTPEKPARV